MKLGITICATKNYAYAVMAQAVAVQSNIRELIREGKPLETFIILISDGNEKMRKVAAWYETNIPCKVSHIIREFDDDVPGYKVDAQKLIATMRTLSFNAARALGCDRVWSLDSDVIPRGNSLICMENVLAFDNGYYSIVTCPYPSQGGGPFLYGFGSHRNHIFQNIYLDERQVPEQVLKRQKELESKIKEIEIKASTTKDIKELEKLGKQAKVLFKKGHRWTKRMERYPAKGSLHTLNGISYRKRGWEPYSIGQGAIVETFWYGMGNSYFNERALNLVNWNGYENQGTEDLFLHHVILSTHGLKAAAILHCPAHHVIRRRVPVPGEFEEKVLKSGKVKKIPKMKTIYSQVFVYFERDGECEGHLRQREIDFIDFNG
jgi:hypothetical protein